MKDNPEIHKRKSIRLKEYDYSNTGMYFITICTQNRECILSRIIAEDVGAGPVSAQIKLTNIGNIIKKSYINLENEYENIKLHDYVIMPNHIHVIIEICDRADTGPAPTIGDIICSYKTRTTGLILKGIKEGKFKPFNKRLWQRNYYEHIIRDEKELYRITQYIQYNPLNWDKDKYNC